MIIKNAFSRLGGNGVYFIIFLRIPIRQKETFPFHQLVSSCSEKGDRRSGHNAIARGFIYRYYHEYQ